MKHQRFHDINISWFNTAFSSGFRVIEIPFILYYLSFSSDADKDTSTFGIILSVIVASTGICLALATPTSLGENPIKLIHTSFYTVCISTFSAILLSFILFYRYNIVLHIPAYIFIFVFLLLAIFLVAVRRIYQGGLIYQERSWGILFSSFVRVVVTILLCVLLPKRISSVFIAMSILLLGALIDTVSNIVIFIFNKQNKPTISSEYSNTVKYLHIAMPTIVYSIQNYIVIYIISILFEGKSISDWVVLYSFISIFLGIFMDIENITANYKIPIKKFYQVLSIPFLIGLTIYYGFYITQWGKNLYFNIFQGINNLNVFMDTRIVILFIISIFLLKQFFKGVLFYSSKTTSFSLSSIFNLLGLVLSGIVLFFIPNKSLLFTASSIYLFGLLFETMLLLFSLKNNNTHI